MFKEALICGAGMVFDMSGSSYSNSQNSLPALSEGVGSDWAHVGEYLQGAIISEGPKIEAEAAKQLDLKLA